MGLVTFEGGQDNLVTQQYSKGRGPVLRSERCEVAKVFFAKGTGAETHSHPEEQAFFCVEGKLEVWLGDDNYVVTPGEASFHPSNVPHRVYAHEDTTVISFKIRASDQIYEATGALS